MEKECKKWYVTPGARLSIHMEKDRKKWYVTPGARLSALQLEPFCASGEQEGNNGQIDDLVNFDDVWF